MDPISRSINFDLNIARASADAANALQPISTPFTIDQTSNAQFNSSIAASKDLSIVSVAANGEGVNTVRGRQQIDVNGLRGFIEAPKILPDGNLNYTRPQQFDPDSYRAKNPDVVRLVPYDLTLNHYLAQGIADGRQT
jgi:hypothetical protein